MEPWKILLITLLAAVLLGCITGVAVGKYQLKKQRPDYKPLLSNKERVIYFACILFGVACIAFGLLYSPSNSGIDPENPGIMQDGALPEGDVAQGGAPGGNVVMGGGPVEVVIAG